MRRIDFPTHEFMGVVRRATAVGGNAQRCKARAEHLEADRDEIIRRWGEAL
jgi:hypothetical protein